MIGHGGSTKMGALKSELAPPQGHAKEARVGRASRSRPGVGSHMTITRREFGILTLGALALPALASAQTVGGVRIGVQTYSFRELPRAPGSDATTAIIDAMKVCGLTDCELWSPQIEPAAPAGRGQSQGERQQARDALRTWRLATPLAHFAEIRQAFAKAGMTIYAFNYSFGNDFTDEEID